MTIGTLLIFFGISVALLGIAVDVVGKISWPRLPGDILIQKDNFTFYFPITTSVILSIVATLLYTLFFH